MEKKVILLTGGSAGIGLSAVEQLLNKDCIVYAGSRNPLPAESLNAISTSGYHPVKLDVNDPVLLEEIVKNVIAEQGKLDAVICNAGFGIAGSVEDSSIEEVKSQFDTNYFGVVNTIHACLPVFRKQGYGKIITTSSVAGIIPIPYQVYYSSVKAAVLMLMNGLATEVKSYNIQCCSVLPGDTKTNFTAARKYVKAADKTSPYFDKMSKAVSKMEKDEQNGRPASFVAKSIVNQVMRDKMCTVVIPGIDYKILSWLGKVLPTKTVQLLVGLIY